MRIISEASREKMRVSHLGHKGYWTGKKRGPMSKQWKEKIGKANLGNSRNKGSSPWNKGTHGLYSEEYKKKLSDALKGRVLSQETITKILHRREMSSLEKKFNQICIDNNLPYKFVGNGKFFIGRKNPDFINEEKKIVIEIYCTKHKIHFRGYGIDQWKNERIETFSPLGWKTIFFNEVEVNEENIKEKLCDAR